MNYYINEKPLDNFEIIVKHISTKTGVYPEHINRIELGVNEDITPILQAIEKNIDELRKKESIDEADVIQLNNLEKYHEQVSNDIKSGATLFTRIPFYWEKITETLPIINEKIKESGQVIIHRRIGNRDRLFFTDVTKIEEVARDLDENERKHETRAPRTTEQTKRVRNDEKYGDNKRSRVKESEGEVREYVNRIHRKEDNYNYNSDDDGYHSDYSQRSYRSEFSKR